MQRRQEICANSQGPDKQKRHRKGENKGHEKPAESDLKDLSTDQEIVVSWEGGFQQSKQRLKNLGITPDTCDETNPNNSWFFAPHKIQAMTEAGIYAQMWEDNVTLDLAPGAETGDSVSTNGAPFSNDDNFRDQYPQIALHLKRMCNDDQTNEDEIIGETAQHHDAGIASTSTENRKVR